MTEDIQNRRQKVSKHLYKWTFHMKFRHYKTWLNFSLSVNCRGDLDITVVMHWRQSFEWLHKKQKKVLHGKIMKKEMIKSSNAFLITKVGNLELINYIELELSFHHDKVHKLFILSKKGRKKLIRIPKNFINLSSYSQLGVVILLTSWMQQRTAIWTSSAACLKGWWATKASTKGLRDNINYFLGFWLFHNRSTSNF